MADHHTFMAQAINLSEQSLAHDGGPFGAIIVKDGKVIGTGSNRVTMDNDPTAHAEVVAIREACQTLGDFSLEGCTIYVNCEPCPMCLARICFNQVGKTYYVYRDAHSPEAGEQTNWERLPPGFQLLGSRLEIEEAQCSPVLKEISRQVWLNSIGPAVNEFLDRY